MNMGAFSPIQPLWETSPFLSDQGGTVAAAGEQGIFADIFQTAINNVKETDAEKNKAEYLLATGQMDNVAEYFIATSKAQLSVDMLVQLRNKALDAYNEINRISL